MENTEQQKTDHKQHRIRRILGWLIAFFVPFILVLVYTTYHWYWIGLHDLSRQHMMLQEVTLQPGDDLSALTSGFKFGLMFGSIAGSASLICYACFMGCRKIFKKVPNQTS